MPTKIFIVKIIVFPVVIYRCESWTVKKVEHQNIDAFELWSWRRLLRVPWTPVFLPGEPHGQKSLAGYNPWGHKSDTTEVT